MAPLPTQAQSNAPSPTRHTMTDDASLLRQPELLHVSLVVPEQPLMVHDSGVGPVTYGHHLHVEFFSSRRDRLSVRRLHRFGKGAFHCADNCGPMPVRDLDWV